VFLPLWIVGLKVVELKLHSLKKYLLIVLGSVSLVLGVIGIFLPVFPTTPFLLLASYCYLRSSERLYKWLINHKFFGAYIYAYLTYKAIPKKIKIRAIIFLWFPLTISAILVPLPYVWALLLIVGIGVTAHLMSLKVLSQEEIEALNNEIKGKEETGKEE
jgi:uncharacterized membrane protein YbaN (DUF454 family)